VKLVEQLLAAKEKLVAATTPAQKQCGTRKALALDPLGTRGGARALTDADRNRIELQCAALAPVHKQDGMKKTFTAQIDQAVFELGACPAERREVDARRRSGKEKACAPLARDKDCGRKMSAHPR
jgi:hypothetical protein